MKVIKFQFKDTGKPHIVTYIDGSITVAMQVIVKGKKGQNLKRYQIAFYDVSKNPHLTQVLTTKHYLGLDYILENTISLARFEETKARKLFTSAILS